MTFDLYRLVYFSRNRIPGARAAAAREVESILATSRRNNSLVSVTGALIFNAGVFAQALEGARRDIELTFERIQRDERHGEVEVLAFEAAAGRGFPSWSMAYVGGSRREQNLFAHIGAATGFDARRLDGERIFSLVREIALEEEARSA